MVFQTAQALAPLGRAATAAAYPLLRILTPLIKFRACRDARKVTGDAMEVRGGCGYIEEWSDPRLLRDAHLGSIWEGTSNIVALDVIRAVQREGSLPALQRTSTRCWTNAATRAGAAPARSTGDALARAARWPSAAAADGGDALARQAASALYHWQRHRDGLGSARSRRLDAAHRWAQLVLQHRRAAARPAGAEPDDAVRRQPTTSRDGARTA